VIDAILEAHSRPSRANGGSLRIPLYWTLLRSLVTVHPLGGCRMGRDAGEGVVDHRGEVFGYPGLFVADGSVLPRPVGRNPSMTIAALAERTARLLSEGRG
jgi:cholesterol oxidase